MMRWGAVTLCTLLLPVAVHAQVRITEIMYAPAGTDTKHEWIEVCADTATDMDGWKLFEADTNHGLSLVSGVSALAANACAIIADDATTFAADYPSFGGNLFDSAFSLVNTGETIVLRNSDLVDIDTVSYTDVLGAKDDGNSLQLQGTSFVAATPTPGTWGGSGVTNTGATSTTTTTTGGGSASRQTVFTYEYLSVEPPQDVYLRVEGAFDVMRNSNARFVAEVYNARGIAETSGNITWNFGDGTTAEGKEVVHRYAHEGIYVLSVRAKVGALQDDQTYTVTVFAPALVFGVLPDATGVRIHNNSDSNADLSGWRVVSGGNYFVLPDNTVVQAQGDTIFDNSVMRLYQLAVAQQVLLYMPNGTLFASGNEVPTVPQEVTESELQKVQTHTNTESTPSEVTTSPTQGGGLVGIRVLSSATTQINVNESIVVQPEPASEPVVSNAPQVPSPSTQVAAVSVSDIIPDSTLWGVALAVLSLVGVGGVWLARASDSMADAFKIEEI